MFSQNSNHFLGDATHLQNLNKQLYFLRFLFHGHCITVVVQLIGLFAALETALELN